MLLVLALTAASLAATPPAAPTEPKAPPPRPAQYFNLVVPKGFALANEELGKASALYEYLPKGQAPRAWKEMVTFHQSPSVGGKVRPERVLETIKAGIGERCDNVISGPVVELTINGLPAADLLIACGRIRQTELGEILIARAISGSHIVYQIQRAMRLPAFPDAKEIPLAPDVLRAWVGWLLGAWVCERGSKAHPCLGPGPPPPPSVRR